MGKKVIKFEDINISDDFLSHYPSQYKYQKHLDYYNLNGYIMKSIRIDENNTLVDGYIDYLILKDNGFTGDITVKTTYITEPNKYVYGKHEGQDKEYCWKVPQKYSNKEINVGDEISVYTFKGISKAIVTRIELLTEKPFEGKIRTVVFR